MTEPRNPLFLGRGSYRQRRLADAARLLPVLGGVLLMLPLLWPRAGAEDVPRTSSAILYLFGCWTLLVLAAAVLAAWLDPAATEGQADDDAARGS
jgi:hypothetical protein